MGQPELKPIKDTSLMLVVNTDWLAVFLDSQSSSYFLLDGGRSPMR